MSQQFNIEWEVGGKKADSFLIQYLINNSGSYTEVDAVTDEQNYTTFGQPKSATVTTPAISQGDSIGFRVRGILGGEISEWSVPARIRLLDLPSIQTLDATDIEWDTATLNGDVSGVSGFTAGYSFRYREVGVKAWTYVGAGTTAIDSLVDTEITNLTQLTNYEFQLYGWNSIDPYTIVLGERLFFKSKAIIPEITTLSVDQTATDSIIFRALISNVTGQSYTANIGFEYRRIGCQVPDGFIDTGVVISTTADGTFTYELSPIIYNCEYEVRAYAFNTLDEANTTVTGASVFYTTPDEFGISGGDLVYDADGWRHREFYNSEASGQDSKLLRNVTPIFTELVVVAGGDGKNWHVGEGGNGGRGGGVNVQQITLPSGSFQPNNDTRTHVITIGNDFSSGGASAMSSSFLEYDAGGPFVENDIVFSGQPTSNPRLRVNVTFTAGGPGAGGSNSGAWYKDGGPGIEWPRDSNILLGAGGGKGARTDGTNRGLGGINTGGLGGSTGNNGATAVLNSGAGGGGGGASPNPQDVLGAGSGGSGAAGTVRLRYVTVEIEPITILPLTIQELI